MTSSSTKLPLLCRSRRGFTLIEILIVITAMAILAGIMIPQVQDSISDAKHSAMLSNLHTLTSAIERYKVHHEGQAPDDLTGATLPQLQLPTDIYGNTGSGPEYPFGPYLLDEFPINPLNGSDKVTAISTLPPTDLDTHTGWLYHVRTGRIWAGEKQQ